MTVFSVLVHMESKPDFVEELKSLLIEAGETYLQDHGTIDWHAMQDVEKPTRFTVLETYDNLQSWDIHKANPHYEVFGNIVPPLLACPWTFEHLGELPIRIRVKNEKHQVAPPLAY